MLAYSSIEHMGILSFGIGLGPGAAFFTLLHALNHSLTKALLFFSAGNILTVYKTKQIQQVQDNASVFGREGLGVRLQVGPPILNYIPQKNRISLGKAMLID